MVMICDMKYCGTAIWLMGILTLALGAVCMAGSETRPTSDTTDLPAPSADDKLSVTQGQIEVSGRSIAYNATAGTMLLKEEGGKKANFFFVAYTQRPAGAPQTRPVTFVFNGGPGAAAVWLHLGAMGPQRVVVGEHGEAPAPPHALSDNPQSWLDLTDLVFIDPVGTGFSRAVDGKAEDFWNVEQDVSSVGSFIRLYLTRYQRWESPKFIAGESYGTTRAAALSDYLLQRLGVDVNGIILISTVLNFQTLQPTYSNELPYPLYLPTNAELAVFHKKAARDRAASRDEIQHFATTEYAQALAAGGALPAEDRDRIAARMAGYIGIDADFIKKSNLRISPTVFRKRLLNDQRLILGRFDARITGPDMFPASDREDYDPSLSRYLPIYESTFNAYVRHSLKFETDLNYEVLNPGVSWDFSRGGMGYLDVTDDLRGAMLRNPHLKLLVASAHFDLATPFAATDYQIHHLDIDGQLNNRITQTYYDSGHMIYQNHESLVQFKLDAAKFIQSAVPAAVTRPASD